MRCHYCAVALLLMSQMMIGRKGLRRNTKTKIAICTFRKLNWMHWVDFNLPHQNPHFSSFLTESDAREKQRRKIGKCLINSIICWAACSTNAAMSRIKSKNASDIVTCLTIISKSFHFTFRSVFICVILLNNALSDLIKFGFVTNECGHISVSWMECVVAVVDVVVDVGLRHRYGLLTILHFDKAHATSYRELKGYCSTYLGEYR